MNLMQKMDAKKAQSPEQDAPASFHQSLTPRSISFVEFRPDALTRVGFPMAQLCSYTLEPNPAADGPGDPLAERLTLGFSTADVVLFGARLAGLIPLLNEHRLEWVAQVDDRYLNANSLAWVGRIAIGRLDQAQPPKGEGNPA